MSTTKLKEELDQEKARTDLKRWGALLNDYEVYKKAKDEGFVNNITSLCFIIIFVILCFIAGFIRAYIMLRGGFP